MTKRSQATQRRVNRITKDLRRQAKRVAHARARNNAPTKPKLPLNKFYVAHPKMARDLHSQYPIWAKPTLAAAIEHAKEWLEKNPTSTEQLVVQVIRVVRRQPMPAIVEKV